MKFSPQPGDVIFDTTHKRSFTLENVDGGFMYSKTLGWMNWGGEMHPHVSTVHREGKQVFPEVTRG